jgi:hypothetical protein
MAPSLPEKTAPWSPASAFIAGQGLALLRKGDRYASLECGSYGGGHGHPDRLNLILHANGEYWLPDFGTGSYVSRDLFWYRSTLAHNAPRLDLVSQPLADASCDNFEESGEWGWARGRFGAVARTVVAGPHYLLDLVELAGTEERVLELPWHLSGPVEVQSDGQWAPGELQNEFVGQVERFVPAASAAPVVLRSVGQNATLTLHLVSPGELLRALGPGVPAAGAPAAFFVVRARGKNLRLVAVLESTGATPVVRAVRLAGAAIEVDTTAGVERHASTVEGWEILTPGGARRLGGSRRTEAPFQPLIAHDRRTPAMGAAIQVFDAPALDGSLEGFQPGEPLQLDHEDQYRRSEEPYAGPEEFSATATLNWSDEALYLAVEVVKPQVIARDPKAPPLRLDNEPDEIHADGIQVYLKFPLEDSVTGLVIVPSTEGGALISRGVAGTNGSPGMVHGSWQPTESGYLVTIGIAPPGWSEVRRGDRVGFDLLVNEMQPDRLRRAGQLVWSGGGGWVWLRGDRQDPARFGVLELR